VLDLSKDVGDLELTGFDRFGMRILADVIIGGRYLDKPLRVRIPFLQLRIADTYIS
jgi:hypothetical protein